jgi:ABC-type transport system involved in multi-copper enzyme maturation permease subunit
VVYVLRLDGWRVFGPVLRYELFRTARQGRAFSLRCLYSIVLLVVLFLVYTQRFGQLGRDPWRFLWDSGKVSILELAGFANSISSAFLAAQIITVYLLTPLFAAGAIAGERERGTLDHLLVTHLHNSEIVLGKLGARLANMTLLVLTGLPVLGFLLFLGGVDPNLVIAGFLATLATMASLGSLGVLNSIRATSTRQAAVSTYLMVGAYQLLSFPCMGCGFVGDIPASGNIVIAALDVTKGTNRSFLSSDLPMIAARYIIFHGAVALVCSALAVERLRGLRRRPELRLRRRRASAEAETAVPRSLQLIGAVLISESPPQAAQSRRHHVILRPQIYQEGSMPLRRPRPRPTDQPLLWKELHVGTLLPWQGPARAIAAILFGSILMATGLIFLISFLTILAGANASEMADPFSRIVGTAVAALLLLGVAIRAAASFSGERERQTLDDLLSTPLDNRTILMAKGLGSILSVRTGCWVLLVIWLLGVMAGGTPIVAFPILVLAWIVYALLLSGIGILCSLASRTTLRATIITLSITAGLVILPWTIDLGWDVLAYVLGFQQNMLSGSLETALNPLATLNWLSSPHGQQGRSTGFARPQPTDAEWASALMGLTLYAIAARILWWFIRVRFGRMTGRMPV